MTAKRPKIRQIGFRSLVAAVDPNYRAPYAEYTFTGRTFFKQPGHNPFSDLAPTLPEPGPEPIPPTEEVIFTGVRVLGVQVPKNAVISKACLRLTSTIVSAEDNARMVIRGQAHDNPPAFGPGNPTVTARTYTTAFSNWQPAPWTSIDSVHDTSDVSDVITEIVDRDGWVKGNAMAFEIYGTGYREFYSDVNGDVNKLPKLIIEWAGPTLVDKGQTIVHNGQILIAS